MSELVRLGFAAVWLAALGVMVLRASRGLNREDFRALVPVGLFFVAGQRAIHQSSNIGEEMPFDLSFGSAVLAMGLVTRFDGAELAPASMRRDGEDGRLWAKPLLRGLVYVALALVISEAVEHLIRVAG